MKENIQNKFFPSIFNIFRKLIIPLLCRNAKLYLSIIAVVINGYGYSYISIQIPISFTSSP